MASWIDNTLIVARKRMQGFGFNDAQIDTLLESGKRDLIAESEKLRTLLDDSACDAEALNKSLHALKGLLLNLGNESLAEKFQELRSDEDLERKKAVLRELFSE